MKRIELSRNDVSSLVGEMVGQIKRDSDSGNWKIGVIQLALSFAHKMSVESIRVRGRSPDGYRAFIPENGDCIHCTEQAQLVELLSERK